MLALVLAVAMERGDAEEVSRGTVSMDYIDQLESLTAKIKSKEVSKAVGEIEFNHIWDKIAWDVGLEREGCMLSIDKRTGEVEEIVIVDEDLHRAIIQTGKQARLKANIY